MDNTSSNKGFTSRDKDANWPCTSRVTAVPQTEHVVQFECDELTSFDKFHSMHLPPPQSNGRNSLRSSLVGYVDAECFCGVFKQWPDEVLTRLNEKHSTDKITQYPMQASRQSSIDQYLLDMLFSPDLVPFYVESEYDQLYKTEEDGIIFQSGSSTHISSSGHDVGNASIIDPIPFCDGTTFKNQMNYQIPEFMPERASRQNSMDPYLLDVLLNVDSNQNRKDAIVDDVVSTAILSTEESPSSKKRRRIPQNQVERIYVGTEIHNTDVVCGRGEWVNRHPGHKLFHHEKKLFKSRYLRMGIARKEKTAIAQELVNAMHEKYNSRFLEYCKDAGQWYIISSERALEKAKQVLREASFTSDDRKEKRHRYYQPKKQRREETVE
jgi:hypothetical protein